MSSDVPKIKKKKKIFFVNMGAKLSKRYSSYKSQLKVLKFLPNFPAIGPHKTIFWIFEIWVSFF